MEENKLNHVITTEDLGNLKTKIHVVYDSDGVDVAFDKATQIVRENSTIKGFRKGKAPVQLVKNHYEDEIRKTASSLLESEGYLHGCYENKLQVINAPKVENSNFNIDGTFTCDIIVDVKPKIEPNGYVGLQLTRIKVDKDKIRDNIENEQRTEHMKQVSLESAELGSFVKVDYVVNCEGKQISNGEDQTFIVREGQEPPFGENLVGKVVNEKFVENIVLPEEVKDGGKPAEVKITIKEVFNKVLPTNEELVEAMKAPSYEELMKAFDKRAEYVVKEQQAQSIEEEVITKLLELHTFDVPTEWIDDEEKYLYHQFGFQGDIDISIRKHIREMAERNVKRTFMLEAIYDAEPGLKVEKEEFDAFIEKEALSKQVEPSVLLKDLKKNNMLDGVFGLIKHRKVLNFIVSQANIVDEVENEVSESIEDFEIPENPMIEVEDV